MIYTNSLSHPNMFSVVSGKTMIDTSLESINRCIALLLLSAPFELFGKPDFGSGLYGATFDYASEVYFNELKMIISDAITKFEKRVTCTKDTITVAYDPITNYIHISIGYTVKGTNQYNETTFDVGVQN